MNTQKGNEEPKTMKIKYKLNSGKIVEKDFAVIPLPTEAMQDNIKAYVQNVIENRFHRESSPVNARTVFSYGEHRRIIEYLRDHGCKIDVDPRVAKVLIEKIKSRDYLLKAELPFRIYMVPVQDIVIPKMEHVKNPKKRDEIRAEIAVSLQPRAEKNPFINITDFDPDADGDEAFIIHDEKELEDLTL